MVEPVSAGLVIGGVLASVHVVGAGIKIKQRVDEKKETKKRGEEELESQKEGERLEEANRPLEIGITHHMHEHLLNEVDWKEEQFTCGACTKTGTGRRYVCVKADCSFKMHSVCASSPVMLVRDFQPVMLVGDFQLDSFAHKLHLVKEVYEPGHKYDCGHCKMPGESIRYVCEQECEISLHPICAKSPTRLSSFMHPEHDLDLITRPHFVDCAVCGHGKNSNNKVYACLKCNFYIHPTCSLWPQYLFHELHPVVHPLKFEILPPSSSSKKKCSACKKKCKTTLYHCIDCDESFHPECLLSFALSGKVDEKMDIFKNEVIKHNVFHVSFLPICLLV